MLHNISLSAGLVTEIAKNGKFINVVLAAGEIVARVTMMNDKPFETVLVSGMSFPVPTGFKSVSFESKDNQLIQVWLSELPLTYSPLNSKVVGSDSLSSTQVKSFFNEPMPTVIAKNGRGKITLQAEKPFFVGGSGVVVGGAIKVDAFERFTINTQGAVYTYTNDPVDRMKTSAELRPLVDPVSVDLGSTARKPLYNHLTDELIFFDATGLKRVNRGQNAPLSAVSTGLAAVTGHQYQRPFIDGDTYVLFGFKDGHFCKSVIALSDYTFEVTILVENAPFTTAQCVNVANNNEFLVCDVMPTRKVFRGNLDGSNVVEVDSTGAPTHNKRGWILPNGDIALIDADKVRIHVTADNGVTWEVRALPVAASNDMKHWCRDDIRGIIFYSEGNGLGIAYSDDNCLSWKSISTESVVYSLYSVNGVVFVGFMSKAGVYDLDTGEWDYKIISGANFSFFEPSKTGLAFAASGSGVVLEFAGKPVVAGGMSINVLEELN
jgi:hypothetical protein